MDYDPQEKITRANITRLIVVDFTGQGLVEVTRFNWLELETTVYHKRNTLSTHVTWLIESLFKTNWSPQTSGNDGKEKDSPHSQ